MGFNSDQNIKSKLSFTIQLYYWSDCIDANWTELDDDELKWTKLITDDLPTELNQMTQAEQWHNWHLTML